MKIKFINVGKEKVSWEQEFETVTYAAIHRSIRKHTSTRETLIFFLPKGSGLGAIYLCNPDGTPGEEIGTLAVTVA